MAKKVFTSILSEPAPHAVAAPAAAPTVFAPQRTLGRPSRVDPNARGVLVKLAPESDETLRLMVEMEYKGVRSIREAIDLCVTLARGNDAVLRGNK